MDDACVYARELRLLASLYLLVLVLNEMWVSGLFEAERERWLEFAQGGMMRMM